MNSDESIVILDAIPFDVDEGDALAALHLEPGLEGVLHGQDMAVRGLEVQLHLVRCIADALVHERDGVPGAAHQGAGILDGGRGCGAERAEQSGGDERLAATVRAADDASPDAVVRAIDIERLAQYSPQVAVRMLAGAGHLIHDSLAHRNTLRDALLALLAVTNG